MVVGAPVKLGLVGLLGATICATGGILYALFPGIIEGKVKDALKLVNGTDIYEKWLDPPMPIYMQFYVFNVTNVNDIQNFGAKPIVKQVGPYTYREYRKKRNITWSDDNQLMSFYQDKYFVFLANMSSGSEADIITTINVPIIALTQKIKNEMPFLKSIINNFLYKDGIFITKSMGELFFKGYKVDIIDKMQNLLKMNILPNGTFGFFYGKNNTDDGHYVFHTGVGDASKFGTFSTWNESRYLPYWDDEFCRMINGTDGTLVPPFVTKHSILYGFVPDLCRAVYATFEDEREIEGINAYRFSAPYKLFANSKLNPDNKCFCRNGPFCEFSGLLDVSKCNQDAPVSLTAPHFYLCDMEFQRTVIGLNPNKFEHETVMDIEPTTGVVLNAARRMQMNVAVEPIQNLKITENLSQMLFPIFWLNESATITTDTADDFKAQFQTPVLIGTSVIYSLIGVGGFIVLCVILYGLICFRREGSKHDLM